MASLRSKERPRRRSREARWPAARRAEQLAASVSLIEDPTVEVEPVQTVTVGPVHLDIVIRLNDTTLIQAGPLSVLCPVFSWTNMMRSGTRKVSTVRRARAPGFSNAACSVAHTFNRAGARAHGATLIGVRPWSSRLPAAGLSGSAPSACLAAAPRRAGSSPRDARPHPALRGCRLCTRTRRRDHQAQRVVAGVPLLGARWCCAPRSH